MKKIIALTLIAALCLGLCSAAFAASSADNTFMSSLKGLENYLKSNIGETDLGNKAIKFLKANYPSTDIERLNRCLKTFLRCGDTVPLNIRLESYAKDITSGYASMYDYAVEYGTSPDVAADTASFDRGWYGAAYGSTVNSPQESRDDCYRYVPHPCFYCR